MLVSDIMDYIETIFTSEEVVEARWEKLIARAVDQYSQWNPRIVHYTFTTTAETRRYAMPTGCIGIHRLLYFPLGQTWSQLQATTEALWLLSEPPVYHQPSLRVLQDINESAHLSAVSAQFEYIPASNEVELDPEPQTALETVYTDYYAKHALTVGGTTYATIPDEDIEHIAKLALANYLEGRRTEIALQEDYTEGMARVSKFRIPENVGLVIEDLRRPVRDKYGRVLAKAMPL